MAAVVKEVDVSDGLVYQFCGWKVEHKPHIATDIADEPVFNCLGWVEWQQ